MGSRFVAVDLETTGVDPQQDYIAEVGLAGEDYITGKYFELSFALDFPDGAMSEEAAKVNGWGKRIFAPIVTYEWASGYLVSQLNGVYIVGKNPQFDEAFLTFFLHLCGLDGKRPWHYNLVDVGALAWGYTAGLRDGVGNTAPEVTPPTPPRTDQIGTMFHVEREKHEGFHTALCDARWAYKLFRSIIPKED